MGTATLTLTDFLLARIEEDEAQAHFFDGVGPEHLEVTGLEASPEYATLYVSPARVLAECEAKRRIVELHPGDYTDGDGRRLHVTDHWCWESGSPYDCDTLRALALPYADHPNFRDEWRP